MIIPLFVVSGALRRFLSIKVYWPHVALFYLGKLMWWMHDHALVYIFGDGGTVRGQGRSSWSASQ